MDLRLGIETTTLAITGDVLNLTISCRILDAASDSEVERFVVSRSVGNFNDLEGARAELDDLILSKFVTVRDFYTGRASLDDLSLFQVASAVRDWRVTPNGKDWIFEHPVSGSFAAALPVDGQGVPGLLGRARAVLGKRLPPPTWSAFASPSVGSLRYRCGTVGGADKYAVYANLGAGSYQKLGESVLVDDTLSVGAGSYSVAVAGVDASGIVGLMGSFHAVTVPVQAASAKIMKLESASFTKEKSFLEKLAERLR